HLLNLRLGIDAAAGNQGRSAGCVLQNEVLGVFTALDVLETLTHSSARFLGDDARASHVLAIFRVVGNGVVHVGNAAFVDQVHDQLQLVQTLEVSHFRSVAGFDQGFETCLDQLDCTTTQNGLFAEQVGLGLFAEGCFDDAGATAADGASIGQADIASGAGFVLMHSYQCRHTAALVVGATNGMTRCLGRHHDDVYVLTRLNLAVVHVEAMSESQYGA